MRLGTTIKGMLPISSILLTAALLRLWGLGWLPSAAGDEGNWALYAFQIAKGGLPSLAPDAAFVTLLYAHLMSASMEVFGFNFFAGRLPNAFAGVLVAGGTYVVLARLGAPRAGLVAGLAFAVHPWSVLYSRICSVPYAIALVTMTLGPLLFVAGVLRRRTLLLASGILITALGAHFSPLCIVAAAACGLFCLQSNHRWVFRAWPAYAAGVVALLHVFPIARGAAHVAATAGVSPFSDLPWRAWSYIHMLGTGLLGEASLRHFTSHALPAWPASVLILPVAALAVAAARPSVRAQGVLKGFAPLYLLVAVVTMPLVLGAGRDWHLPFNHFDRYLFAVLPAFLLCLAELAHIGGRRWRVAVACTLAMFSLSTARAGYAFLASSSVDHGEMIFDGGGGYRGWLVSADPRNTLFQIRDALIQEGAPGAGALLVVDRVFIPMEFVLQGLDIPIHDVRRTPFPAVPGGRYFFVIWADSVLSVGNPPTAPPRYVAANSRLRRRMEAQFAERRLVRRFVQRDGAPLLELWRAEQPRGRLVLELADPKP